MKRRVTACPRCERQVGVTKSGNLVRHRFYPAPWNSRENPLICEGSGKPERVEQ